MEELIATLERAEEGSRELDAEIEALLTGWVPAHLCSDNTRRSYGVGGLHRLDDGSNLMVVDFKHAPHYTTSSDAALTLVPEGFDWDICFRGGGNRRSYFATVGVYKSGDPRPTPALALCIAALKARKDLCNAH